MDAQARTLSLLESMCATMPALKAVGVECVALSPDEVLLVAPLERNQNDKATAFAGSLNGLGLLAGWMLTQRLAFEFDAAAQCAVYDAHTRFRQPVRSTLRARCRSDTVARAEVLDSLEATGRARWTLDIDVGGRDLDDAVRLRASYAIWVDADADRRQAN